MIVNLTKTISLKSADAYLKIKRKAKRDDIQKYLQGKHFDNGIVENRVRDYLKSIGIYDENFHLTTYGNEVKETGMVDIEEEGKYEIWYTQDDSHFDEKIFFFKRIVPNTRYDQADKDKFKNLPIREEVEHFCLKSDKNEFISFSVISNSDQGIYGIETPNNAASLNLSWKWKELESSHYTFAGKIDGNTISDEKIEVEKDLEKIIMEILPDWDSLYNRYKIPFSAVKGNNNAYIFFEYAYNNKWKDFTVSIDKLPVEPYNFEEAVEWRNAIFNKELENEYMHPDEFEGIIAAINGKEGFSAYAAQLKLDIPDKDEYRQKLDHAQKSKREKTYWHLAAPLDLNVDIPQALKLDSFSLAKNENISFENLASKFGMAAADKVFYYDKYVTNYYQQRSVCAFLKCFGVSDICIITDTAKQSYDSYLSKNKPGITVEDISSIYQQNRKDAPHDRYIVFKNGGDLTIWTSTNSSDFIRFNFKGEIPPNTPGTISQGVTFTKVKQNVLGKPLEDFIMEGKK